MIKLESKKEENNQKIKKPTISSQVFKLISDGRTPVQVAIDLQLDFGKVKRYWTEFLQLNKMKKENYANDERQGILDNHNNQ